MLRATPPFRADHVGSLLRPQFLKDARAQREAGEISAEQLQEVEDRAIREVIAKQESAGLQGITDGEFRRSFSHLDFLEQLDGVESYPAEQGLPFQSGLPRIKGIKVTAKINAGLHPMIEHFKFLKANTSKTAKVTIPSPSMLHYRGGRKAVSESVYPTMDEFYNDVGQTYKNVVGDFGAAGCKCLQLDEVNFTYLCDEEQRQMLRARGDQPEKLPEIYADMINAAISGRTPEMRVVMHLCRGNFRSMWIAVGGYEPVADVLFNKVNIDAYFMEWDTDRAGGFEPLRLVPKNKQVVLGVVTSKTGSLEEKDDLKRRIDEAAKFIDLDQLCLSPQCGFASTEEGNVLTEEEQWAKLRRIVEVADEVWG
ncbi:MAG: 5-methyltetrahydropteroyltriglutamate--homocysteine S-methyltransferase [Acidobacteriia bacterium]|nr:5-methyltetrahydropteroyltriglutamate--homocysteine S-methyltransferase [Terriglobia bacterium]